MPTTRIRKGDHCLIHGIYVGRNSKNNKCIIQLIEPNVDDHIEISEKYIKHIEISDIYHDDDDDDIPFTQRDIEEEWNNIIGEFENYSYSMAMDSAETCDSWTLNDCGSCKRVLFCLSYYKLWINYKYKMMKQDGNNNNAVYVEQLIEFIHSLRDYTPVQMLNDFQHIKQFHINNNNQYNHIYSADNVDQQDVFEFFKKEMGICNHKNCRSYLRNNRDRNQCTTSDQLRKELYFVDENNINAKHAEIKEINIQQLFDMIHCALFHPLRPGSSKFITEIDDKTEGNKVVQKEEEDEDEEEKYKEKDKVHTAVLSSYGFGTKFKYHDTTHKSYVEPKFDGLKSEMLNNALYTINEFDFDSLISKATDYKSSYRGRYIIARKQKRNLNTICDIPPNAAIHLDHIIALMLYTNMDDLQREFKKKGCKFLASDHQIVERVKKRHREITNWCRLIWESITFYGESITKTQLFYHGLNCKVLFNSLIATFNCPISTTVNKSVAYNFSTDNNGIIVQFSKYTSVDSHYLDVSDLSDYPNEQER